MLRSRKCGPPATKIDESESDSQEQSRILRPRKASRSTSQCLSSVTSSAEASDAEAVPYFLAGRGAKPETPQARHAVVIDHQGAGKVVHKPDGTVVWEPAPESNGNGGTGGDGRKRSPDSFIEDMLKFAGMTILLSGCGSGLMGFMGMQMAARSGDLPVALSAKDIAVGISHCVAGTMAGLATGMILGPLMAVRTVAGALVRPALVGVLAHQGITRIGRWRSGVAGLLRKLQSGDIAKVLEALRAVIAAARRNPRFAREFNKLKGIEVLLQRLALAMPDCPLLHLIAQALAELCKDQECRDSLVAAGGVPRLVALLRNPNPIVSGLGLSALARLADHSLAVEAIRESGGLTRLVELTIAAVPVTSSGGQVVQVASPGGQGLLTPGLGSSSAAAATAAGAVTSPPVPVLTTPAGVYDRRAALLPAVKLLKALSLDPPNKAAIGAAGGVRALLDVIARSEPRSETQSEAIAALHSSLRGCPDNQRTLAALPQASEVLRAALAGYGPCWYTAKSDLHAMLNVLARLQGVQEAGGFVVVQSQVAAAASKDAVGAPGGAPTGSLSALPVAK